MRGSDKGSRGGSTLRGGRRTADEMMACAGALLRRARAWTETPGARAVARFRASAGRAGYVAKGALYCVVGGLAIDAGVRPYDPFGGARNALVTVQRQWMGQAVVGVLAAGLAAYGFWQLVQAVLDPMRRAKGLRGLGFRAVCVVSAALYGTLAWQGARLLAGATVDEEQRRRAVVWMRAVLAQPMGRWALLAVGLAAKARADAWCAWRVRDSRRGGSWRASSRGSSCAPPCCTTRPNSWVWRGHCACYAAMSTGPRSLC
jgi:hypothetical protein